MAAGSLHDIAAVDLELSSSSNNKEVAEEVEEVAEESDLYAQQFLDMGLVAAIEDTKRQET
ncbi:hypothetical protein CHS0354_032504 [Potamilus streckersoni]|uniref:Uncharacterized protein n=1 Tax=Potamilus streckersoni TaxID=2493646 RepID=A0AAE0SR02_9BIVA|nr:hypothetical protein CHS0354_032504 [Potamilus streckersoni]